MSPAPFTDTICALSTPPGTGAIAIVRLSGKEAFPITGKIFIPANKNLSLETAASHTLHFGTIGSGDDLLDEVVVSLFRGPHSYTGDDVIEISCHGSPFIQQKLLELLITNGARMAEPGEFTLRAFLNGRFDLSQAEAVADLIASHSGTSHDLAIKQMRGGFSRKIKDLRARLIDFTSLIELELDFSEEDVEFANRPKLQELLEEILAELETLIGSFTIGNVIRTGIPVAIIGRPNVGKSTLLNAILNEEKAIVSDIPGTTRDAIEDTIVIGGYSFRFIDTAGLRESTDTIETIGIERTWQKIQGSTVILYLFDATTDTFDDVKTAVEELSGMTGETLRHMILVGNKTDLLEELPRGFKEFMEYETVFVSAKRKENIHLLAESLLKFVVRENISEQTIVSNARHLEALQQALNAVQSTRSGLGSGIPTDLLSTDIRMALHHLGEITGEITTDEILGNIFSKFCIGK
jgi:tRNA modification GTPase